MDTKTSEVPTTTTGRPVDAFDRRYAVGVVAVVAMIGVPVLLVLAGLLDLPYLLVALALVIPALCAVPVALESRHRQHGPSGARRL